MEKLLYENIEVMLKELSAREHNEYFLCKCPKCEHREAFMYKKSNVIKCNRENNCGVTFKIEFKDKVKKYNIKNSYKKIKYNERQLRNLEELSKIEEWEDFEPVKFRGINNKIYDTNKLSEYKKNILKKCLSEFYISDVEKRNIIIPLKNHEGKIERVLLRSTEQLKVKEKQLILTEKAINYYHNNLDSNKIIITEAPIDSMSVEELNLDFGVIGLTGVQKQRQVIEHIKNNLNTFRKKEIFLAFDNDPAGQKYQKVFEKKLSNLNLKSKGLNYAGKDLNESLEKNPQKLKKEIKKNIKENTMSNINNTETKNKQQKIAIKNSKGWINFVPTSEQFSLFQEGKLELKQLKNQDKILEVKTEKGIFYEAKIKIVSKNKKNEYESSGTIIASSKIDKLLFYASNKIPVNIFYEQSINEKGNKSNKLLAVEDGRSVKSLIELQKSSIAKKTNINERGI